MTNAAEDKVTGKQLVKKLSVTFGLAAFTGASLWMFTSSMNAFHQEKESLFKSSYENAGMLFDNVYRPVVAAKSIEEIEAIAKNDSNVSILRACLQKQWDGNMIATKPTMVNGSFVPPNLVPVTVDYNEASICFQRGVTAEKLIENENISSALSVARMGAFGVMGFGIATLLSVGGAAVASYQYGRQKYLERKETATEPAAPSA